MNNYQQPGNVLAFTPTADVVSGQVVVIGTILGVANANVAANTEGLARIDGVFSVPKVAAAVIGAGETLTWDVSAGAFDDNAAVAAAGDITGSSAFAFAAAGAGAETLLVKFTGTPGTVETGA